MDDRYVVPINNNLPQISSEIPNKNSLNSYFPIRTKGNDFDWDAVIGIILRTLLRKKIDGYSYESFKDDCYLAFKEKLGEESFWDVLNEMYFEQRDILSVSPEFLLFRSQKGQFEQSDARIASMFTSMLQGMRIEKFGTRLNFIEHEILTTLSQKMRDEQVSQNIEEPYLPFLSYVFRKDLKFLSSRPKYFLSEIKQLLSFYAFSYSAQLSLSLGGWKEGAEPKSRPLYFIMDHERASSERTHIKNHGYKLFQESSYRIFPMLTMLELLQPGANEKDSKKIPLWEISRRVQDSGLETLNKDLENFAKAFCTQRELNYTFSDNSYTALDWLEQIIRIAQAQFQVGERKNINKRYVIEIEKTLASHFIQSRGRSGRVLVLNQDYIVLLTNLVIAEAEKIRFQDLLGEFRLRGVYVDKQTEQELIKFYDRIGNVERMSDSGDAIYVRKTI